VISSRWLQKRRPYWARADELTARSEKGGIRALSHNELQELALLYRQTASDLATIREDPSSNRLAQSLNQLLGRAHNSIYMGRRAKASGIVAFYRDTFPQVFHDTLLYTLAACAVFFATAAAGFVMAILDPGFQRYFLGGAMMESIDKHQMWTHSVVSIKPLASSAIMTNNLTVSFATFALGITAGVGTVWMLAFNGLLFGVVNAACWQAGMSDQLLSFVAPHGVLELPAIFIAGGGGLLIAKGLLFPGTLSRREALVRDGGRAMRLALGIIPLLIVAGTVEGFISPTDLAARWKYLLAAALFGLLILFVLRKTPPEPQERAPAKASIG
jgi:uncharacterized membrane protein SpoIIM required for sporulation